MKETLTTGYMYNTLRDSSLTPESCRKPKRTPNLFIKRDNLAILHAGNTGGLLLLVLTLVVSNNLAQVGLAAGDDIVWFTGLEGSPVRGKEEKNGQLKFNGALLKHGRIGLV
jgi:hypothetical protein